jgi:hypothetical protein
MTTIIPHPANVPGDFYVEKGCCMSCNMPFSEAPDLFSSLEDGHCYVSKQPTSPAEIYRMTQAFAVSELGCIRYKGINRVIKIKLIAIGAGEECDQLDADLIELNREIQTDIIEERRRSR